MTTDDIIIIGTTLVVTGFLLYEAYKKKEESSVQSISIPSISFPSININPPSISIPHISVSSITNPSPSYDRLITSSTGYGDFSVPRPSYTHTSQSTYIPSSKTTTQQNTGWYGITKPAPGQNKVVVSSGSDVCTITLVDRSGIGGRVAYYLPNTTLSGVNNIWDPWYQIDQTAYATLPPHGSLTISTPCWSQVDVLVGMSCAIHPNCHWYTISKPVNGKTYYVT